MLLNLSFLSNCRILGSCEKQRSHAPFIRFPLLVWFSKTSIQYNSQNIAVGTAKIHNNSLPLGPLVSISFSYPHLPHPKRNTLFTHIATWANFSRIMLHEKKSQPQRLNTVWVHYITQLRWGKDRSGEHGSGCLNWNYPYSAHSNF